MASERVPNRYPLSIVSPEGHSELENLDFFDGNRPAHFPSPAEVRENPVLRKTLGSIATKFDSLNIIVKYGVDIAASEAYCLRALQLLPEVPVPKVYGWCEEGGEVFIYMELIQGVTLESQWEVLSPEARKEVCTQLRTIVEALRKVQQDPNDQFLGRIDRKPLLDTVLTGGKKPPAGPFNTVKEFHDWLSAVVLKDKAPEATDPIREHLPDDSKVVFTHADLHRSNIMVSADGSGQVLAIIDWHQSGWYPNYWEYCKALYTAWYGEEWAMEYIPQFVDPVDFYDWWEWYPHAFGY
ncbi:kinase-like protein [Curvularia clavata]|uniref:Kinase-like protein n=1 Tax=Curvularia clavata TaxID=95742 RepID=A0A9Q8ZAA5_CURCL|nr:kinase-like protein [Curvularia clavata]